MRHDFPACVRRSKIVPFSKLKPDADAHFNVSPFVWLLSSPPADAACTKKRFGNVGPGIDACQLSNTTNSLARAVRTGSCLALSKHFITSPKLSAAPPCPAGGAA